MRLSSVGTDSEPATIQDVSEAFFTELVAAHHADLVRLAYAMVGEIALAHDVAQGAWAAAWRNRAKLRDPALARRWLLKIAANEARAALRRRRRNPWARLTRDAENVPTRLDAAREERMDVVAAVQRLPPRDRQMLALRYALGETSAEIGSQVGMSESGVRVRLGRLLRILRKELDHE